MLLVCNVVFIWGNSMLPAEMSKAISGFVRDVISQIFSGVSSSSEAVVREGILRKIAHFLEFSCLGVLLCWLFAMLDKHWVMSVACGFTIACIDETIQCFVPNRGPGFLDVLLDTAGVAFGIAMLLLGYALYKKKQNGGNIK